MKTDSESEAPDEVADEARQPETVARPNGILGGPGNRISTQASIRFTRATVDSPVPNSGFAEWCTA